MELDFTPDYRDYTDFARRYGKRFKVKEIPDEDLKQEIDIITWECCRDYYRKHRYYKLADYICYMIRVKLPRIIAGQWLGVKIPRRLWIKINKAIVFSKRFENRYRREPTDKEISDGTRIPVGEVIFLRKKYILTKIMHFSSEDDLEGLFKLFNAKEVSKCKRMT